jgi:type IV pilus assembly protein PilV
MKLENWPHSRQSLPSSRGFTLIEMLAAIVVLSVGVLGVATLQLKGLRQGKGSLQATQATAFAYSLADMMRANKAGSVGYLYDATGFSSLSSPGTDCRSSQCSPAEIALFDTYYWYNDYSFTDANGQQITVPGVKTTLGAGATAWVQCQVVGSGGCSSNSVYRIGVFWDRNRGSSATATKTDCFTGTVYDASAANELACVVVSVQL